MLLRLQERLATRSRVDRQWHFYRGGHGGERFQMQWSVGTDECRWAGPAANTRAGCGWDGTGVWARRVGLAPAYLLCTGRLWTAPSCSHTEKATRRFGGRQASGTLWMQIVCPLMQRASSASLSKRRCRAAVSVLQTCTLPWSATRRLDAGRLGNGNLALEGCARDYVLALSA